MHTGAFCDIAWDEDGKQTGFISFPYSIDRSPYYQIKVPVCRIANGAGASLLLMAGNHGRVPAGDRRLTTDSSSQRGLASFLEVRDVCGI